MGNLTGQKFGRLEVIGFAGMKKRRRSMWKCHCDCGKVVEIREDGLKSGHSKQCKSCGLKDNRNKTSHIKGMIGKRFGTWTVKSRGNNPPKKLGVHWNCVCDCGNIGVVSGTELRQGNSPGCLPCGRKKAGLKLSLPNGLAARNATVCSMKNNSRVRGYGWFLSDEAFDHITQAPCFYCGLPPSNITKGRHQNGNFIYSGIDRRNNSQDYHADNCVPCCWTCNKMKSDMGEPDFLSHIERVFNYQHQK